MIINIKKYLWPTIDHGGRQLIDHIHKLFTHHGCCDDMINMKLVSKVTKWVM